jgi:hypothetical protein
VNSSNRDAFVRLARLNGVDARVMQLSNRALSADGLWDLGRHADFAPGLMCPVSPEVVGQS